MCPELQIHSLFLIDINPNWGFVIEPSLLQKTNGVYVT